MERRRFLERAAVGAGLLSGARLRMLGASAAAAGAVRPPWFDRPMRWGQLTLVEDDPPKLDVGFWADLWKRCHCDAVCLSAGGVVAYYPTQVPLHHRSLWLGDRDPFGELVKAARGLGMVVWARLDPHAAHEDFHRAHSDWFEHDQDGSVLRHWVMPEMYLTCRLGPYNFEHMPRVVEEVLTLYDVDAIFANRWVEYGSFQVCYCPHCRRLFRERYGLELPSKAYADEPSWKPYTRFYQERIAELWKLWDATCKRARPGTTFVGNTGGSVLNAMDWKTLAELADTMDADNQGRSGVNPPWRNGEQAKVLRSVAGRKAIIGIFGINTATSHRWMRSVKAADEQRLWMAEGVANGFRPWWTLFGAEQKDRRWIKVVEEFYAWCHRNEAYLRNTESLARVGVVYSQQTAHHYGKAERGARVYDHFNGIYHALVESRIPFDLVHDRCLEPDRIGRYSLLVLPNVACLSDGQCEQLRDYVRRGGSLVATLETSLYDEGGERRRDFGLGDVLGVSVRKGLQGPLRNSYMRFESDATGRRHPLLAGLEDTEQTVNGIWMVDVLGASPAEPPMTLIPPYPDLPMEKVFPTVPRTDVPTVYAREVGRSRVVYFPIDIDRVFWEVLHTDHLRILRNTFVWASGGSRPVEVEGPGLVEVTLWRQERSLTAHLVNLSNPMMFKGPVRELLPVGAQRVTIEVPAGARVSAVKLLVSGAPVAHTASAGRITLTVPRVLDREVVAVDLA